MGGGGVGDGGVSNGDDGGGSGDGGSYGVYLAVIGAVKAFGLIRLYIRGLLALPCSKFLKETPFNLTLWIIVFLHRASGFLYLLKHKVTGSLSIIAGPWSNMPLKSRWD